jgi:hypothetical protein
MTKNREKMVEFYQKIFGLEPRRGFGGAIYMSDGDVNIALIEVKRESRKKASIILASKLTTSTTSSAGCRRQVSARNRHES